MKNKFYNFKNMNDNSVDLYVYGAITSDKWYDDEIDLSDFKESIEKLNDNSTLNVFVNSPGGDVFTAVTITSMLKRCKDKGVKIKAFVDGLCASAATFLVMVADEINMYKSSTLMIHKPMSMAFGNADDMQKQIDVLNTIQENTMIPLYLEKSKVDENELNDLINKESWLSSKEASNLFNINVIDENKEVMACVDNNIFKNYKNVPEQFKNIEQKVEKNKEVVQETIDYSLYEKILKNVKEEGKKYE